MSPSLPMSICQPCPFLGSRTPHTSMHLHRDAPRTGRHVCNCVSDLSLGLPSSLAGTPSHPVLSGLSGLGRPKPHPGLGNSPTFCSQGRRKWKEKAPQRESSISASEDMLPLFFSLSLAATSSPIGHPVTPRACREALPEDLTLTSLSFPSSRLAIPGSIPGSLLQMGCVQGLLWLPFARVGGGHFTRCLLWSGIVQG